MQVVSAWLHMHISTVLLYMHVISAHTCKSLVHFQVIIVRISAWKVHIDLTPVALLQTASSYK